MVKYIISTGDGFVGEGKMKYGGELYAILTDKENAKRYSTKARAESARNKLLLSRANMEKFSKVMEVEE